jgi:hypothetical protein
MGESMVLILLTFLWQPGVFRLVIPL